MKTIFSIAAFGIFCISGCSNSGLRYADSHSELSSAHRQILITGAIPAGAAVQGMTKEQVSLALGRPKRIEKNNGQDVWIYAKATGFPYVANSQFNPDSDLFNMGDLGDCPMTERITSILFKGNTAIVAQIHQDQP